MRKGRQDSVIGVATIDNASEMALFEPHNLGSCVIDAGDSYALHGRSLGILQSVYAKTVLPKP